MPGIVLSTLLALTDLILRKRRPEAQIGSVQTLDNEVMSVSFGWQ